MSDARLLYNDPERDATEALEIAVAKRLGYRAVLQDGTWDIATPDGQLMYCEAHDTEADAWTSAILHYGPEWSRQVDAAMSLPVSSGTWLEVCVHPDGGCSATIFNLGITELADSLDDLPRAICKVWLQAKESEPSSAQAEP